MGKLRSVIRSGAFVSLSTGMLCAYEVNRRLVAEDARQVLTDKYCGVLVSRTLDVFGAKVSVNGHPVSKNGALVVANHQSALDIAVMLSVFQPVMVSRHDVADWPLLGRMAKYGGTIFVNRDDRQSGARAVRTIRRLLKEGRTVAAFPEGGTFGDDALHDFHPGLFAAAGSLDVPILPVGIAYSPAVPYGQESFARHLGEIAARRETRISLRVGAPLPPNRDARTTAHTAREHVQELIDIAREDLDAA